MAVFKKLVGRGTGVRLMLSGTALTTALFLGVAGLPVLAQTYSFNAVKVEGNSEIEAATVLKVAGLPKGKPVSAADINDATQRLTDSGLFASVDLTPSGGTLVIHVTENPTINVVSFEGNRRIKDDAITKLVKTQSRHVFSAAQAEADAAAITKAYSDLGRLAARVEPRVIKRDGNKVDVVFEIREGKTTEVERLSFTGNRAFSDRRLRQVLATKQAGIFRQFIAADTFVADRTEYDKTLLTDFYKSRGFIDARVNSVSSEFSRERDAFFLTFNVEEGLQYSFRNVGAVSEYQGVDAADFAGAIHIRSGETYSPTAVDDTITRMEDIALKKGIDFLSVEPRITRNARDQTLDVAFVITKGPRVFVERIDIQGNSTTLDKVVRRQFHTVEGDPFNPREIRAAAARIRALGFFKNADVSAKGGTAEDQVIVDVNVEEQPTGALTFGASYSVSDGIGFSVGLSESNFLGRGQYVAVKIGTTTTDKDSSFTFIEPALLDRDLKLKLSGWYTTTDKNNSFYGTKRLGFSPALEFPLGERTRLELRYTVSSDEIRNVSTSSSPFLLADQARGSEVTSALGYTLSFDSRGANKDALSGLTLRFGQDFAGFGGDIKSVKSTAKAAYETKIMHEEVTLHGEIEGGMLQTQGNDSRLVDRFTGNSVIRGFATNGFGPRDLSVPNRDALGGKYFAVARAEAQFPLGLPDEYGITGGVFADIGSVWGLDNPGSVDDKLHLRSSIGFSIFWDSKLGPLRLNFAKALKKEPYDKTQIFDLTISTQF